MRVAKSGESSRGIVRWLALIALTAALGVCVFLPWWRNHGLLRDFYDYGNVIAGAGRIAAGDHPYADFLTPIQALQYYQAWLAERLWGARYLSLTYANAVLIITSFCAFAVLLKRRLGWSLALLIAAAVVTGTSAQHAIVWYNALGIAWLATVVWLGADLPHGWKRHLAQVAIVAALWLGGMTKLTYQFAALAFAILFTIRDALRGTTTRRAAVGLLTAYLFAGTALPIATEMLLTGATFAQWRHNVLQLASARTELLHAIASWRFYVRTPHYYYEPIYLSWVGAWGVGLLLLVAVPLGREVRTRATMDAPKAWDRWILPVAAAGAAICGLVFLAAHFEIVYVSGAAWLLFATGLVIAFGGTGASVSGKWAHRWLAIGAASLLVTAWLSAWQGARSLNGHGPLDRSQFVSADDLPARFGYLRGLKLPQKDHSALLALSNAFDRWFQEIPPDALYFVHATEWLTRVVPEARHPKLPLWLQSGTTFGAQDASRIENLLNQGSAVQLIVAHEAWDYWQGLDLKLDDRYTRRSLGGMYHVYRLRRRFVDPAEGAVAFAQALGSNLSLRHMTLTGEPLRLIKGSAGYFAGAARPYTIRFNFGLYRFDAEMVAELRDGVTEPVDVTFRARFLEGANAGSLCWNETMRLSPQEPKAIHPLGISPGAQKISLEVDFSRPDSADAGWRALRTDHAGPLGAEAAGPVLGHFPTKHLDAAQNRALFADDATNIREVQANAEEVRLDSINSSHGLQVSAPGELWVKLDRPVGQITGQYTLERGATPERDVSSALQVFVVYYKSGRFEIMHQHELSPELHPDDASATHPFRAWMPESDGWIGLLVSPVNNQDASTSRLRWHDLKME